MRESRRIMLTVSYDGTAYAGWQRQLNAPSVQAALERALLSLTGEAAAVTGASRTDAGVHALGQAAHFDTRSSIPAEKFSFALNTRLPDDVRVVDARLAAPDFHARYGARGKTYRYQIHNSPHASALYRHQRAHVIPTLDAALMRNAGRDVLGEHDFRAFAAAGCEAKSTVREITEAGLRRDGELIELTVSGRSFLYNMVRILAGSLIYIGMGKLPPDALAAALRSGNRLDLGFTAPAHGLTLMKVRYTAHEEN
ncbi:MAG: tRNA pseudouridine(38-40) synthase TruA [Firmicutes bacterium]|nr:tRNA pseudouridine(38-40) synthase TruA [Bacillota bacterium]